MRTPKCACCGATELLEWDHIIPVSNGGSDRRVNLQRLCRRCNYSKGIGLSCRIDHSLDTMNDLNGIPDKSVERVNSDDNRGWKHKPADGLVAFNTRISAKKKEYLLKTAQQRGVSAGVVLEEIMNQQTSSNLSAVEGRLAEVERKIDSLIDAVGRLKFRHLDPENWHLYDRSMAPGDRAGLPVGGGEPHGDGGGVGRDDGHGDDGTLPDRPAFSSPAPAPRRSLWQRLLGQ
jgi:hypothetical protein